MGFYFGFFFILFDRGWKVCKFYLCIKRVNILLEVCRCLCDLCWVAAGAVYSGEVFGSYAGGKVRILIVRLEHSGSMLQVDGFLCDLCWVVGLQW